MRPNSLATIPPFVTVSEIAQHCKVHELTVRRWLAAKRLPFTRVGRSVRVSPADFEAFLAQGEVR